MQIPKIDLSKNRFWTFLLIRFNRFYGITRSSNAYQKSPTPDGDFPQRGKLFSGTENVLRTSKHNLPCACAHCF